MSEYPSTPFGGDSDAKFWSSHKDGDEIVGTFIGTKRGGKYNNLLARLRDDDGGETLVSITRALEDIEHLPIGTRCRIKFLGWAESSTGTKFKKFAIFTMGEVEPVARQPEPPSEDPTPFTATDDVDVPF